MNIRRYTWQLKMAILKWPSYSSRLVLMSNPQLGIDIRRLTMP